MQRVVKYTFSPEHTKSLRIPKGAIIVSSDIIGGIIILWLLVDITTKEFVERQFILVATDENIPVPPGKELQFIGTYQTAENHVIHLFELIDF